MKRITNYTEIPPNTPIVATIGMFDGVHLGHQQLLQKLVTYADSVSTESLVFSFDTHPRIVLYEDASIELLNTSEEKQKYLAELGIPYYVPLPFDRKFANQSAFEFVRDILVNQFHITHLLVGHDHHFGKNREGNFEQLKEYAAMFDFEVHQFEPIDFQGRVISSTKIRRALKDGEITLANAMLGYDYPISGTVVTGKSKGKELGFPTANLKADAYKLIPKEGVYIAEAQVENHYYPAMVNIGVQPTLKGSETQIEAHLLSFSDLIYGERIKISFKKYLREEQKFSSEQELISQLEKDKISTQQYFGI